MAVAVVLMLAGVLPVRGGGQESLFRSPVLFFVLTLLGASTVACTLRRKLTLRSIGYHLAHASAVLIMIGAMIGALAEKKFDVQLELATPPLHSVRLSDGASVDLGFGIAVESFHVDRYPPNLLVLKDNTVVGEHRLAPDAEVSVGEGSLTVARVLPHADIRDIELDGTPELIVGDPAAPIARVATDTSGEQRVSLPDGSSLFIARAYNNLPNMRMGHTFRETAYPVRPGLILHVMASNQVAILSLAAGEAARMLSPSDPAKAPPIPPLYYSFPDVKDVTVSSSDNPDLPFAAELLFDNGAHTYLLERGAHLGDAAERDGHRVVLDRAADRRYEAGLVLEVDGESRKRQLVINKPIDVAGWRIYLNSYDSQAMRHVTLTLRRDPGDRLVVAGVLGLMIGTVVTFFIRRKSA
ncbi:MAG: hypothetical protein QGH74_02290 [Candidatus Brocadiia bacterium]|jgi:hypothetical protein|nr:hypothetical protein [Candidatus Brocadiia bacterium]